MGPLVEQMLVDLADRREEPIRVVPFPHSATGEVEAQPIPNRGLTTGQEGGEQALLPECLEWRAFAADHALDRHGIRMERPHDHAATPIMLRWVHPEHPVRVAVFATREPRRFIRRHLQHRGGRATRRQHAFS